MSQQVYAVVINWNGGDENLRCLRALQATGVEESHIVFVDNGSKRGSLEQVRSEFPDLIWVQNDDNTGFAAAANQGAENALRLGAEWILFINNDLDTGLDCLEELLSVAATDDRIGALAPRVLLPGEPARIWSAGGVWNRGLHMVELIGYGVEDAERFQTTKDVDFLTGAALMVRRKAYLDIEGFEASYFAYMEDVELCHRLRKSDWRVVLAGQASAVHHASVSTGGGYSARRKYMMAVNTVRFLRRRGTGSAWLRFAVVDVATWPVVLLLSPLRGQMRGALAKGMGMWHGLIGKAVTAQTVEDGASRLW